MPDKRFSSQDQLTLFDIMSHRRDVRGNLFRSDPLSDDVLDTILCAAERAPSVGFSQPWRFVVVRSESTRRAIYNSFEEENALAQQAFHNEKRQDYLALKLEGIMETPVNLAVFYAPGSEPVLGQTSMKDMGEYSVVCAVQNMWLMARAMNVGMGWVSILDPEKVKRILHSPPEYKLVAYLCLGYVSEFYTEPELEKRGWATRKPINQLVYEEAFPQESASDTNDDTSSIHPGGL